MIEFLYPLLFILEILILYILSKSLFRKLSFKIFKITKRKSWTIWIMAALFIIGTFIHEMSHFLVSLLLLVPVSNLELVPEIQEKGIKMGSVQIAKTDILRRNIIGIAPFLVGIALIIFLLESNINKFLIVFFLFEIGNTMFSSKKDLESLLPLLIFVVLLISVGFLLGIRIDILKIFSDFNIFQIIKNITLIFIAPVVIDIVLLLVLY